MGKAEGFTKREKIKTPMVVCKHASLLLLLATAIGSSCSQQPTQAQQALAAYQACTQAYSSCMSAYTSQFQSTCAGQTVGQCTNAPTNTCTLNCPAP